MLVFSLYDSSLSEFLPPAFFQTEAMFKRSILTLLKTTSDNNHIPLVNFPEQFMMYCLGSFDEKTGSFNLYAAPQQLGLVSSLLNSNSGDLNG